MYKKKKCIKKIKKNKNEFYYSPILHTDFYQARITYILSPILKRLDRIRSRELRKMFTVYYSRMQSFSESFSKNTQSLPILIIEFRVK